MTKLLSCWWCLCERRRWK